LKAAGILFYHIDPEQQYWLLLGHRVNAEKRWRQIFHQRYPTGNLLNRVFKTTGKCILRHLNAGKWSVFGGYFDRHSHKGLLDCAIREAKEETIGDKSRWHLPQYERIIESLAALRDHATDRLNPYRIRLPGFSWDTYFVRLNEIPSKQLWPLLNNEFSACGWCKLNDLHAPIHLFLGPALKKLQKRI
jgi:8-oxo-dGTP pyrophosphatase MutT (NUDIX family)